MCENLMIEALCLFLRPKYEVDYMLACIIRRNDHRRTICGSIGGFTSVCHWPLYYTWKFDLFIVLDPKEGT